MKEKIININNKETAVIYVDTAVIGSGCAGFNAADCLYNLGRRDIALFTEAINAGTSRNTGSDKQTYYKLSIASSERDSIDALAETLRGGGSVHGDNALAEAAGSVQAFMKLTELGVPFPKNTYGEFVGYKTDHDPLQRATSCGPFTSKIMTESLEKSVREKNIAIFDGMQIVKLLCDDSLDKKIKGAVAIKNDGNFAVIFCSNIILCTGGPAAIYERSVYPECHTGSSGLAVSAGAVMNNLQEWQYGLASTAFRWNVSGTFQQVMPKYISVDNNGNEREFLVEYISEEEALNNVFLKGYQWPFDSRKINGSSVIDLIVYHESIVKGNRVFMDFRSEPYGLNSDGDNKFAKLSDETKNYLKNSGALVDLPIQRLKLMNPKAIELYKNNGIDLFSEPLEVMVCSQHNNGGIAVDANWQSSIKGLYAAGEAAGTFGVYRPGGSALNSTQIGSRRAAEHIACFSDEKCPDMLSNENERDENNIIKEVAELLKDFESTSANVNSHFELRHKLQSEMSKYAAHLRDVGEIERMLAEREKLIPEFFNIYKSNDLRQLYKTYDILTTQAAVLSSMALSGKTAGSRGSALILAKEDEDSSEIPLGGSKINYREENADYREYALETFFEENKFMSRFVPVRPMPQRDTWFETVWRDFSLLFKK